jgi:predicted tellurium resistance membrane protein TerC
MLTPENLVALLTLTSLEIVLGIDNIVFIAILVGKIPEEKRAFVRRLGIFLAMFLRIALLFALSWVMGLTKPVLALLSHPLSGRDIILVLGGLFLVGKATYEIHDKIEGHDRHRVQSAKSSKKQMVNVILQILMLDLVFSLDSVITAVGMVSELWIMIAAVMIAVGVMLIFSGGISHFIEQHPSLKILALSFLVLIGVLLIAEGFGQHIDKGYVYFAMGYALLVEFLNIRSTRKRAVV